MGTRKVEKIDISKLKVEDIDAMGIDAMRDALRSVVRGDIRAAGHRDHRSHSDTPSRALLGTDVSNPAGGGGLAGGGGRGGVRGGGGGR